MTKRISVQADPTEKITADLVGTEYVLTPPKSVFSLKIGQKMQDNDQDADTMLSVMHEWLTAAMGKKQADAVQKRLDNSTDQLDLSHVMQLIEQVTETQTGDPTSSSSDSST